MVQHNLLEGVEQHDIGNPQIKVLFLIRKKYILLLSTVGNNGLIVCFVQLLR